MQAYLNMIPVLAAEESFRRAEEIAVGTGSLERRTIENITRAWSEDATRYEIQETTAVNLKEMTKEQREEWATQRGIRVLK